MEEILKYAGERELEKIEAFWAQDLNAAENAVKEFFDNGLLRLNHQSLANLSVFFRLSVGEIEVKEEIKINVHKLLLELFITWLNSHSEDNSAQVEKIASEFKLCVEAEKFYYPALDSAFQIILDAIKNGAAIHPEVFSIFSQLLNTVNCAQELLLPEGESTITGSVFCKNILEQLCSKASWAPAHVVPLVHCACDLTLTSSMLEMFVEKIATVWSTLEIDEIPPLVYQLLLLSNKGLRGTIVGQIVNFFNELPSDKEDEVEIKSSAMPSKRSQIEGTVILHIFEASRNERELGHYIVNKFKGGKFAYLSPFTLGVLLALSRNSTYQTKALEYLKSSILSYYQDGNNYNNFPAMRTSYVLKSIEELFHELLSRCHCGWDLVLQGLIEFFIGILDTQQRVFWKTTDTSKKVPQNGPKQPLDSAHILARKVLLAVFKDYEIYKLSIFERILARLITNSDSTVQYTRLLKVVIHSGLHQLSDVTPKIKDAIPILTSLPLSTAKSVLEAWAPLINHNPSFLDLLIMVLKKGLFIKKPSERLISLKGLIFVLEMAGKGKIPYGNLNEGPHPICLEILGILRRCLTQQAEIRIALYDGLKSAVTAAPALAPQVTEFLFLHVGRYYNASPQASVPVKLTACLNPNPHSGPILSEPLPSLMAALVAAVLTMNQQDQGRAHQMLLDLTSRMPSIEPNVFGLDDETIFNQDTLDGMLNSAKASLLLGIYENLMDFTRAESDDDVRLTITASLYERHNEVFRLIKAKALDSRGKPIIKGGIQTTFLPVEAAFDLLQLVSFPEESSSSTLPRAAMVQFLLEVSMIHANALETSNQNIKTHYSVFATISNLLVIERNLELDPLAIQMGFACLNKLLDSLLVLDGKFAIRFTEIMCAICPSVTPEETAPFEDLVLWFIDQMMTLTRELSGSQATLMLELVNKLLRFLHYKIIQDGTELDQLERSLKRVEMALRGDLGSLRHVDVGFAKQVLKLYLLYCGICQDFSVLPYMISFVQKELGLSSPDSYQCVLEIDEAYTNLGLLFTMSTIPGHLSVALSHLLKRIEIFSWAITQAAQNHELDKNMMHLVSESSATFLPIEDAICQELSGHLKALSILACTAIQPAAAEQLLDVFNSCYKFLKTFTRHKLKNKAKPSESFVLLMEQVETDLTRSVFVFISWFQNNNTAPSRPKKSQKVKEGDHGGRSKGASKEIRMLSSLTLNLEQFELLLYQIYSKYKIKANHEFRRSTIRDFRIDKGLFMRAPSPEEEDPKAQLENFEGIPESPVNEEVAENIAPDAEEVAEEAGASEVEEVNAEDENVVSEIEEVGASDIEVDAEEENDAGEVEGSSGEEVCDDETVEDDQDRYDSDMIDDS